MLQQSTLLLNYYIPMRKNILQLRTMRSRVRWISSHRKFLQWCMEYLYLSGRSVAIKGVLKNETDNFHCLN